MAAFIDSDGLINSRPDEVDAENKALWTLEYLLVKKISGVSSPKVKLALYDFFEECKIRNGLYNQRDFKDGTAEDYMSHDQLTAICAYSYMNGWAWHKHIWDEIKRQKFRYDNISPNKPKRWLHPRDIIYYGILNDVWWCKASYPIFKKMMQITCKKKTETSGKLLALVRVGALMERKEKYKKLFLELTDIIRDNDTMKSWEKVFKIYFPYDDHPLRLFISQGGDIENKSWIFERK